MDFSSLFASLMEILNVLSDPSYSQVALGSLVLGTLLGVSGSFIVVRRLTLMGDVLAHSAIPGMALAWVWLGPEFQGGIPLTLGALASIGLAWKLIQRLSTHPFLHPDAAFSCVLGLFFGLGLVLVSLFSHVPGFGHLRVERLFLGNIATILRVEIYAGLSLLGLFCIFLVLFWKPLWAMLLDPNWPLIHASSSLSFSLLKKKLDFFIFLSIALAMRSLGILLLITLSVAPAVLARHHFRRSFGAMCLASGIYGALFCVLGGAWSAQPSGPPTGPAIVLLATFTLLISVLFFNEWRPKRLPKPLQGDSR
jgi:manganese/zinc/iron transport system permease protein